MRRKLMLNAGLALTLVCASATTVLAKTDKEFLTDALKGDNSEVSLGQLAAQKAKAEPVRSFGQTLVTDHSAAKEKALPLAKSMGVPATTEMMDEAVKESQKLNTLSGEAFDKEFVRYMVKDHKMDIKEFGEQAAKGGETGAFAKAGLPMLRKHLKIAQSLRKSA